MRTIKALACMAALAACITASLAADANVYSVNVVGYYNIPYTNAGSYIAIANQLNATNNMVKYLLPNGPVNAQLFMWDSGWRSATFDEFDNKWLESGTEVDWTLAPGQGMLFKLDGGTTTLTFVGEVLQSPPTLTQAFPGPDVKGMISSKVPQAGQVSTALLFPAEANDQIFQWDYAHNGGGGWEGFTFDEFDSVWKRSGNNEEPVFGVGESFMVQKAAAATITAWTRNFTVQ